MSETISEPEERNSNSGWGEVEKVEPPAALEAPPESPEETLSEEEKEKKREERILGARMLANSAFQERHKEIVESSFKKALEKDEKLEGKNAERRTSAYISRLEKIVKKHGSKAEKRLWEASVDKVMATQENKENRDELESWSNYLADENSPYPMWFKVYAFDGVTKLERTFDKEKGEFKKRNKQTINPYPALNPAALAKTYEMITESTGLSRDSEASDPQEKAKIEALVAQGNFNKLYSRALIATKEIQKTPERTEDIKGDWVEYKKGEEEKLATASEGTPWCIAAKTMGESYLKNDKTRFLLFHLEGQSGDLSKTACASIRLDEKGEVAEISGLEEDQDLEDSLIPIVEEKVLTLPGGEKMKKAFEDQKELIRLRKKLEQGEKFTPAELEFVIDKDKSQQDVGTYTKGNRREKVLDVKLLTESGMDVEELVSVLEPSELQSRVDDLLTAGADPDKLASRLGTYFLVKNYDSLASAGVKVDLAELARTSDATFLLDHREFFEKHGVPVDPNKLVAQMSPLAVAANLKALSESGVKVDVNALISNSGKNKKEVIVQLLQSGADVDKKRLFAELPPVDRFFWMKDYPEEYEGFESPQELLKEIPLSDLKALSRDIVGTGLVSEQELQEAIKSRSSLKSRLGSLFRRRS